MLHGVAQASRSFEVCDLSGCRQHDRCTVPEISQAGRAFGGEVDYFVNTVFNYPTLAECHQNAAFDGINRLRMSLCCRALRSAVAVGRCFWQGLAGAALSLILGGSQP